MDIDINQVYDTVELENDTINDSYIDNDENDDLSTIASEIMDSVHNSSFSRPKSSPRGITSSHSCLV